MVMLTSFQKRFIMKQIEKQMSIEIDFQLKKGLIYYKNNRLCIPFSCERNVFEKMHDKNMHVDHHKNYEKLVKSIFIFRMSRKLRQYIKHCFSCELNQIKRHASYEELAPISTPTLSFRKITMNFILILSKEFNTVLIIFDKITRRKTLISGHDIITTEK